MKTVLLSAIGGKFCYQAESMIISDNPSMATMLVQTNNWSSGLNEYAIYTNGVYYSADITCNAAICQSETEEDEYLGAGYFQASRQTDPNTGAEENNNVTRTTDTDVNVPALENMIRMALEEM